MSDTRAVAVAGGIGVSAGAFACSGPGAAVAMLQSVWFGWGGLMVQSVLAIGMFVRFRAVGTGPGHPAVLLALTLLHPAWWISAYAGDCGATRDSTTVLFSVLTVGLRFWQESLYKRLGARRVERS